MNTFKSTPKALHNLAKPIRHGENYSFGTQKMLTMAEHRHLHPQPELFHLIHKWNLSSAQEEALDTYTLRDWQAGRLTQTLDFRKGRIKLAGVLYTPIYQNTSRQMLKRLTPDSKVWLSFRKAGDIAIVLIQQDKSAKIMRQLNE